MYVCIKNFLAATNILKNVFHSWSEKHNRLQERKLGKLQGNVVTRLSPDPKYILINTTVLRHFFLSDTSKSLLL